jgi:demethoxyubiquinone hydroxylase (CLK1/Coq7/Cat5 family)
MNIHDAEIEVQAASPERTAEDHDASLATLATVIDGDALDLTGRDGTDGLAGLAASLHIDLPADSPAETSIWHHLAGQQRELARETEKSREHMIEVFGAIERAMDAIRVRIGRQPDPAQMSVEIAAQVEQRMAAIVSDQVAQQVTRQVAEQIDSRNQALVSELQALRASFDQRPQANVSADFSDLAEPLAAALDRINQKSIEHLETALSARTHGLYEALKEDLEQLGVARTHSIRKEVDRVLYFALGIAGLVMGGALWAVLKP